MPGLKKLNAYALLLAEYDRTPKAVYAAVAVSFAALLEGADVSDPFGVAEVRRRIKAECEALYINGIVPQKPIPTTEA